MAETPQPRLLNASRIFDLAAIPLVLLALYLAFLFAPTAERGAS